MNKRSAGRKPRGVETALLIWSRVERGALIAEELRALDDRVAPADRTLAASLCYAMCRRLSLWEYLRGLYMLPRPSKFSHAARTAALCGIAGLVELRNFVPAVLISSLVDWTKARDPRGARAVNAVLRRACGENASQIGRLRSRADMDALCLLRGVPPLAADLWTRSYGSEEATKLIGMCAGTSSLSLRLSPDSPRDLPRLLTDAGYAVSESPLPGGLRVEGTFLPSGLPCWDKGWFAAQSESSMLVGREAADFDGTYLLDMCAGRGVKTGQIALTRPDVLIEAWDLSSGRSEASAREMERLGVSPRVLRKTGDALLLSPERTPDAVLVDAPCSGSGTWRRHPEGKWRLTGESLENLAALQERLLDRAFALVKKGGKVVYSTCSLFDCENERVVRRALDSHPEMRELPAAVAGEAVRRETGYAILPDSPWADGFYLAVFIKD